MWAERTPWGSKISGPIITIAITFLLSNFRVIPAQAPSYEVVWSYLVPLAIPLLLFQANLVRIISKAGPTLVAYIIGAVGTVIGTVIAYYLLPLGEAGWKLAAIFCATYIGGSVNFAATADTVGLRSGDLLSAGVAADNLLMSLYFIVLFTLPSMGWLQRFFPGQVNYKTSSSIQLDPALNIDKERFRILDLGESLAISAIICALGYSLATTLGIPNTKILLITVLIIILATLFPTYIGSIKGAEKVGVLLMHIFFATIGASANIEIVFRVRPLLFIFAAVILIIHLFFLLLGGWLFKLKLSELAIASNANTGGPTTAAAMAAAKKWPKLVTPAILCGTLGYGTATFIGVALGKFLGGEGLF